MSSPRSRLFVPVAALVLCGTATVVFSGQARAAVRQHAVPDRAAVRVSQAPAQRANPLNPFDDCVNSPIPELPGRGVVGFFDLRPDPLPAKDDPFQESSRTTILEQYGYAGLRYNTYDPSCSVDILPDAVQSPDAAVGTSISNWILTFPKTAVAATGALLADAYQPDFLSVFDPLIASVVKTLRVTVFDQWSLLMIAAIGFAIIWRARRIPLASGTAAVGWALFVMLLATLLFRWPVEAGHVADSTVKSTLSAVTGGLNGVGTDGESPAAVQAASNLHESLLYTTWLGGTFGDSDSEVAKKYGPAIFDAQSLTWRETDTLRKNPAEGKKILEAKRKKFKETASKIKSEDPDAYEYLVGHRSDSRVGYSVLATIATLCAIPFLVVSCLLVIGALVIVRFGVMLFPVFATLGLFPSMRGVIIGIGNTVAAAVINAILFGIGSAVTVKAMGVVLAPETGLASWLDVVLVLLLTIVMWVAMSPFRRLTTMVAPRNDHFGMSGLGRVRRGALRLAGARAGEAPAAAVAGAGIGAGAEAVADRSPRQQELHLMGGAARAEAAALDWAPVSGAAGPGRAAAGGAPARFSPALAGGPAGPGTAQGPPALPSTAAAARARRPGGPDDRPVTRTVPGDPERGESASRTSEPPTGRAVAGAARPVPGGPVADGAGRGSGEIRRTESSGSGQPDWMAPAPTNDEGFIVMEPQEIQGEQVMVYRPPDEATDPPMIDLTDPAHRGEVRDVEAAGIGSDATFHVPERS